MCGIAGYSLSGSSSVDRTLSAQALLAGIAERGADAVGYAHRGPERPGRRSHKQRSGASELLDRVTIPAEARSRRSSTCATTPRVTRRSPRTTTRFATGRSSGSTTGSS